MSEEHYQAVEIAGESEEVFLKEAYDAWVESQASNEPEWPPSPGAEPVDLDDISDLPDPMERRPSWDDGKSAFRPFHHDTGTSKIVSPDSIAPFLELLPNLELGGNLRGIIDGMLEKGRLHSLSDISMLFRNVCEDAIRHRKYDPRILREADTYFGDDPQILSKDDKEGRDIRHGRSLYGTDFGKLNEPNLLKTNSYVLASAHPGVYKVFLGIFIADMNARLQSFVLRAIRTEDFSMSYGDLSKMAYAAGQFAVEQGLDIVDSIDAERSIGRTIAHQFKRLLDLRPAKKGLTAAELNDMGESHAILYGRRFKLRRGETRTQRLARYKKDYPAWAKQRIVDLEKQHLKLILATGFAHSAKSATVDEGHFKAAEDLIKSAKKTPGQFSKSRDLIDIACGHDDQSAGLLLQFFDKQRRRTELMDEVFSLGRTLSRVQDGRKVIRAKDKHAGELLAANAILRSNLGVPSIKDVQSAMANRGLSVTDILAGMKRKLLPGVSAGMKKALVEVETKIRSASGKAIIRDDLSVDDFKTAKKHLKNILKDRLAKGSIKTADDKDADSLAPARKPNSRKKPTNGDDGYER